jgi:hypothetical protein
VILSTLHKPREIFFCKQQLNVACKAMEMKYSKRPKGRKYCAVRSEPLACEREEPGKDISDVASSRSTLHPG